MNIVEYTEKVCNWHLKDFQKDFLNKAYEYVKNNQRFIYIPPRGSSRFCLDMLRSLAVIIVAYERDLLKDKEE